MFSHDSAHRFIVFLPIFGCSILETPVVLIDSIMVIVMSSTAVSSEDAIIIWASESIVSNFLVLEIMLLPHFKAF